MSLDFVLLGPLGLPEVSASVGVDAHHRLTKLLDARLPLLHRASSYYEDTSYGPDEVAGLIAELQAVGVRLVEDQELRRFVDDALEVLRRAMERSCGVEVVAD